MLDKITVDRVFPVVNAGARLDRLPAGSFHRRVMLLIGVGMFIDACDIYLAPGVMGALVKAGWSDLTTNAWFMSATFGGMLIGTLSGGFIGDRFGRRFSYQANLLVFGLASLAAAFAPNMGVLIALRFVMGIGLGAEIVVGYSSLAEFMPRAVRGRYVATLATLTNLAVVVVGFGGLWIIPTIGWRYMFAIIGFAAAGVWLMRKNMPESPRWLESRGRLAEAEAAMQAIENEVSGGQLLPPIGVTPTAPSGRLRDLFGPRLWRATLLGAVISAVGSLSLYGFLSWVPTFLLKEGIPLATSLLFSAVMGLGAPLGALLGAMVADRFGRPRIICAFTLIEAAFGAAYPFVGNGVELMLVGFGLTLCAYALVAIAFGLYTPELFPTELRLRGAAVVGSIGRLAGASVGFAIAAIFTAFGIVGVATFLVCALLVQALAVMTIGPETSDRSLEEIAADNDRGTARPLLAAGSHG
jgi:MFS transporter, putative metabolite:H+ symporter